LKDGAYGLGAAALTIVLCFGSSQQSSADNGRSILYVFDAQSRLLQGTIEGFPRGVVMAGVQIHQVEIWMLIARQQISVTVTIQVIQVKQDNSNIAAINIGCHRNKGEKSSQFPIS
jgi:hypothetical protein